MQETFEDVIYDNVENLRPGEKYVLEETESNFQHAALISEKQLSHQNTNEVLLSVQEVLQIDDEELDDSTKEDPDYIVSKEDNDSESSENETSNEGPVQKKPKITISKPYARSEVENRKQKKKLRESLLYVKK